MSEVSMQELGKEIDKALKIRSGHAPSAASPIHEYLAGWLGTTYAIYPPHGASRVTLTIDREANVASARLDGELVCRVPIAVLPPQAREQAR